MKIDISYWVGCVLVAVAAIFIEAIGEPVWPSIAIVVTLGFVFSLTISLVVNMFRRTK